jgi:hypothetical protein
MAIVKPPLLVFMAFDCVCETTGDIGPALFQPPKSSSAETVAGGFVAVVIAGAPQPPKSLDVRVMGGEAIEGARGLVWG